MINNQEKSTLKINKFCGYNVQHVTIITIVNNTVLHIYKFLREYMVKVLITRKRNL